MSDKKVIVGGAAIKAIATTALIGGAINRMDILLTTTDAFTTMLTSGAILVTCLLGSILYSLDLSHRGILKTATGFFHTYGITWYDNTDSLLKSWMESGSIAIIILVSILFAGEADWGIYPVIVSIVFGLLCVYIFRKDCTTTTQYIRYFIYGYLFGIGMVLTGVLISFLMTVFGMFWIGLLIAIDFGFTGVYTYLDLLEWEHEEKNKKEVKAESEPKPEETTDVDNKGVA